MQTVRHYVATRAEAEQAVSDILSLFEQGLVEDFLAVDIETMPISGLEGYPSKDESESGNTKWPSKKDFRLYWLKVTGENFDLDALRMLNIVVPRKRATKKQEKEGILPEYAVLGKAANEQWAEMRKVIEDRFRDYPERLQACMKPDAPLKDIRLWKHILDVSEDGRMKVDPVSPGLDPYTSDIFLTMFTARRKADGVLVSWMFNNARLGVEVLRPLLQMQGVTYFGQNFKFDLRHFLHHLGEAPERVFCTRIASRILTLGLQMPHSLAALVERYLGRKVDKGVRDTFIGVRRLDPTLEQIEYGFTDTEILWPLKDKLYAIAEERGQVHAMETFAKLSLPTAYWEQQGYIVDAEKWMQIYAQVVEQRDKVAAELERMLLPAGYAALFDDDEEVEPQADTEAGGADDDEDGEVDGRKNAIIRISQTQVVKERLTAVLGFPVESLSKDGRTQAETEYRQRNKGETHPFFSLYAKWSKLAKQASTYGKKFLWAVHPLTGRVHPVFTIAGTDTGRYTCNRPNLLNIPTPKGEDDVDFRAAFLAPEGYLFGNADYAAMEQRIAACITQDPVLVRLFLEGGDSHSVTAAMMFHLRRGNVSEPTVVEDDFRYGTETKKIKVLVVPQHASDDEMFRYATSEQVLGFVDKKTTRTIAKMVGFLFYFGGSAYTLAVRTNAPVEQAEDFFNRFTSTYAVLAAGFQALGQKPFQSWFVLEDGTKLGYAEAYGGLRRYFELPEPPSRNDFPPGLKGEFQFQAAQKEFRRQRGAIEREGKNMPTQGGNAMITAEAILLMWELGKPLGIKPWLAIYDEFLVLVPKKVPASMANWVITHSMTEPAKKYMAVVPADAEPNPMSPYWAKF